MWAFHDGVWHMTVFPLITVECVNGVWVAFFGGRCIREIRPEKSASTVMRHTFDYFDARIDLVSTEKIERMMKGNRVYV